MSSFCVVIFNFIVAKKIDFSKTTEWTNLSIERTFLYIERTFLYIERTFLDFQKKFLFSENKAHFRFFYEKCHVSTVFLRQVSSKFYEKCHIIELLHRENYIIKTASGFFSGFAVRNKNNWFNKKLVQ